MQVGLEIFLNLAPEKQAALILNHIKCKKRDRALERYQNKREAIKD